MNDAGVEYNCFAILPEMLLFSDLNVALTLRNVQSQVTGYDEVILIAVGLDSAVRSLLCKKYFTRGYFAVCEDLVGLGELGHHFFAPHRAILR